METTHKRFNLHESVMEIAQNLVLDAYIPDWEKPRTLQEQKDSIVDKREPATRLFHNCTLEDGILKRGKFSMFSIEEGEGCDYVITQLYGRTKKRYIASKGTNERDVYFENPTIVAQETEDGYTLDFSTTQVNDSTAKNAQRNRDFRGDGYTVKITGLNRASYQYGRTYPLGIDHKGSEKDFITISKTNPDADFVLSVEEIADRNNEWLHLSVHTRAGGLLKEKLSRFSINLETLCPNLYE